MADVDRELERLKGDVGRVGACLLELEEDPNRALLAVAALEGETASRWQAAATAMAELFDGFTRLATLIERATEIRGSRPKLSAVREAELDHLLHGESIELLTVAVPLADRGLRSSSQVTTTCTPDALLASMETSFNLAKGVIVSTAEVWDGLAPAVGAVRQRLADMKTRVGAVGGDLADAIDRLDAQAAAMTQAVLTDPLSIEGRHVGELEEAVDAVAAEWAAVEALRLGFDGSLAAARASLDDLAAAARASVDLHEEVAAKIAGAAVREPFAADPGLAAGLDRIVDMAARDDWQSASAALGQWRASVEADLTAAADHLAADRSPLQERNELRGRLDAYGAKAGDLDRAEDADLLVLFDRARTVLYTAPTDLEEAARRVREYQDAVSGSRAERGMAR